MHNGGGLTVLKDVLSGISVESIILFVDSRAEINKVLETFQNCEIIKIRPTIWNRLLAEFSVYKKTSKNDQILFLGNLPPLLKLKGRVSLYIQNRYLIQNRKLSDLSFWMIFRLILERMWLKFFSKNVDEFIVQTTSMKSQLIKGQISKGRSVQVKPILNRNFKNIDLGKKFDFIYVASGEAHKNHKTLIDAWILLAKEGLFPSLCLTIDPIKYPNIVIDIQKKVVKFGLNILNHGFISADKITPFYLQSTALIYPSTFESFGIPLVEAKNLGLKIIASELDYVRDLVCPQEVFDPLSEVSIARAVKRFLQIPEANVEILSGREFFCWFIGERK